MGFALQKLGVAFTVNGAKVIRPRTSRRRDLTLVILLEVWVLSLLLHGSYFSFSPLPTRYNLIFDELFVLERNLMHLPLTVAVWVPSVGGFYRPSPGIPLGTTRKRYPTKKHGGGPLRCSKGAESG